LAAVEQAVRASLGSGADLVLVDDGQRKGARRVDALMRRLTSLGLLVTRDAGTASEADEGAIMFVGWTSWHQGTHASPAEPATAVVRGAPDDHGERLNVLLAAHELRQPVRTGHDPGHV
jgi:hypothetical protein